MCDQRELMLDYLYDEASPSDRREMDRHLQTCDTCRLEVRSLRRVREDLLAWDVPEQPSVWTPFARPQVVPWYRQVPSWAMAAAAALMFMVGASGGFAAHVLWGVGADASVTQVAAVTPAPEPVAAQASAPVMDPEVIGSLVRSELAKSGYQPGSGLSGATPVSLTSRGYAKVDPKLERDLREYTQTTVAESEGRQWGAIQTYLSRFANENEWQRKDDAMKISKLSQDVQFLNEQLRAVLSQLATQQTRVQ